MIQTKTTAEKIWTKNLRARVGQSVLHNQKTWVNNTGKNSEPGTSNDWTAISENSDEIDLMMKISYADLFSLVENDLLIPGQQYRIIDYKTTVGEQIDYAISQGNRFDIIVTADSENTLNEVARAVRNEADTYFPEHTRFESWELKYSIYNNELLHNWADELDGKGVIYFMKDEFGNEIPYDFKNIKFKRYKVSSVSRPELEEQFLDRYYGQEDNSLLTLNMSDSMFLYTFHKEIVNSDFSISYEIEYGKSFGFNIIKPNLYATEVDDVKFTTSVLNNNVFLCNENANVKGNVFEVDCQNNTFGNNIYSNTFGNGIYSNTFGDEICLNTFGNDIRSNTFGNEIYSNTFGDEIYSNNFGNNIYSNTFGNNIYSNNFGNGTHLNTFGNDIRSNTFGNDIRSNAFGIGIYLNTFGDEIYSNNFGNNIYSNTFGNNIRSNTFGNDIYSNNFGNNIRSNTFGNDISHVNFGSSKGGTTNINYYGTYLIIKDGVKGLNTGTKLNIDTALAMFVKTPRQVTVMQSITAGFYIIESRDAATITTAYDFTY